LPHPVTLRPKKFLLSESQTVLYELRHYKPTLCSFFINDYVCQDGSFLVATKIDPLLLILPLLLKIFTDRPSYMTLEQILYSGAHPGYAWLQKCKLLSTFLSFYIAIMFVTNNFFLLKFQFF
jgi:hypothetical protein